jgi:hypothetical protein
MAQIKGVAIVGTLVLTTILSTLWPNSLIGSTVSVTQQIQSSSTNLSFADLKQPHIFKISTLDAPIQITGKISCNGRLIQNIKTQSTQFNLSPLLRRGRNVIQISGQYRPKDAIVAIELKGAETRIRQEVSGSGVLNQELVLEVE